MTLWQELVKPNPKLNPAQQRTARLFNLLLLIVGIGLLFLIVLSQINSLANPSLRTLVPELLGLSGVIVSYLLNRMGFTYFAAMVFFLITEAIILLYVVTAQDSTILLELRGITPLLTIPIVAAGVIIRPFYSFVFAVISAIGIIITALLRFKPGFADFDTPLTALAQVSVPVSFIFVMAGMSWFFQTNMQRLVNQLTAQNASLDSANQELALKREAEQRVSHRINQLTALVSEAFGDQNRNSAEQLSALLEATTTIEQLNQTNEAITRLANQVDLTAQEALRVAEDGTGNVRNDLQSLLVLSERSQAFADSMEDLYTQARQIDQIIELITEVAEETNLLALNATIEAAGAREYGRRFASVANEVQRLANRSREAADQVRRVVEEIRGAIETSSSVAQQGVQETAEVLHGARQMEQTLEGIVVMVENTATLTRQIALSIQQQRSATVQVVENMRNISVLSHNVSRGNQDLMNNLYDLNSAVTQLNVLEEQEAQQEQTP